MPVTVPLEPVQRPALLPSARGSRAQAADPRLRPLMRGFAYRPDPSAPLWQQALSASLARCEGAWRSTPTATALCCLSAALVLGLWVGPTEPDVHLLMPARPGRSCLTLPAVSFTDPRSGHQLPGRADVRLRKHNRGLEPRQLSVCDGLTVTSLLRTALDCAFDEPARVSLPVLDSAVRALVKPDRFSPQASAHTWKTVRRQLVEGVAAQGARRGARRARLVARLASPLSESYGESVLRWPCPPRSSSSGSR